MPSLAVSTPHTLAGRRRSLRAVAFAAVAATLATLGPGTRTASSTTGGARVTHDPVATLAYVPATGAVELEADKKTGDVTIVSAGAPRVVTVTSAGNLRAFSAVAVPFFFGKTSNAKIRVRTTSNAIDLDRYVGVEQDRTVCNPINLKSVAAGQTTVDAGDLESRPLDIALGQRSGEFVLTITGRFRANVTYRLVFYSQTDKGEPATSTLYDVFLDAEDASVEPDPQLKILPVGADPATGCAGTDVTNLDAAYVAELQARQLITNLDDTFNTSDLSTWVRPTKADDDQVRKLLELSIEHMKCVRKIVGRRTDLDATSKQFILDDVDGVITTDLEAIDRLDIKNKDVKNKALQELGQLRNAGTSIGFALSAKQGIGERIQPGYVAPTVPAGLTLGASVGSAVDVIQDAATRYKEKADALKAKLEQLRDVVRNEGTAGVKRIRASNPDPACGEFIDATLLGELSLLGVAVDRLRREDLEASAAKVIRKAEKDVVKLVALQAKATDRLAEAKAFSDRAKASGRTLDRRLKRLAKATNLVDALIARISVLFS